MKTAWVVLYEDDESPIVYLYTTKKAALRKAVQLHEDAHTHDAQVSIYEKDILE